MRLVDSIVRGKSWQTPSEVNWTIHCGKCKLKVSQQQVAALVDSSSSQWWRVILYVLPVLLMLYIHICVMLCVTILIYAQNCKLRVDIALKVHHLVQRLCDHNGTWSFPWVSLTFEGYDIGCDRHDVITAMSPEVLKALGPSKSTADCSRGLERESWLLPWSILNY